eukprot:scaffold34492_cov60-Phaeocystis_antarctica.AAC.2
MNASSSFSTGHCSGSVAADGLSDPADGAAAQPDMRHICTPPTAPPGCVSSWEVCSSCCSLPSPPPPTSTKLEAVESKGGGIGGFGPVLER